MPETYKFPGTLEKSLKRSLIFFGAYDPLGVNQILWANSKMVKIFYTTFILMILDKYEFNQIKKPSKNLEGLSVGDIGFEPMTPWV